MVRVGCAYVVEGHGPVHVISSSRGHVSHIPLRGVLVKFGAKVTTAPRRDFVASIVQLSVSDLTVRKVVGHNGSYDVIYVHKGTEYNITRVYRTESGVWRVLRSCDRIGTGDEFRTRQGAIEALLVAMNRPEGRL